MVKEGYVTVRSIPGSKDPVLQQLTELQEAAKSAKKGKWSEDEGVSIFCFITKFVYMSLYIRSAIILSYVQPFPLFKNN